MQETASSATANVPPNPQHSSVRVSGTSSIPSSDESRLPTLSKRASSSSLALPSRSSRSP